MKHRCYKDYLKTESIRITERPTGSTTEAQSYKKYVLYSRKRRIRDMGDNYVELLSNK